MPIPEFIVELRRAVGHAPLWLPGVTAVTIRDREVLLVKRSDNGAWTAVTGIVEPGENPADCAAREVSEETGVSARATKLGRWLSGEPFAADDEGSAAAWFGLDELPPMTADMRRRIALSATNDARTVFDAGDSVPTGPSR